MTTTKMTMKQIAALPCQRCGRRKPRDKMLNIMMKDGVVTGVVCGSCQTSDEHLEAEVHAAMVDYSTMTTNGRGQAVAEVKR